MKAIERVKQYIDFKGFNNSSFEKEIELSNGYIATQLKRNADLGEGILNKILDNCLDVSPEWLLTGKGAMLKGDLKLNKESSTQILREEKKLIPLYDGVATAGTYEAAILDPTQQAAEMIDAGDWFRDATAAMRVHGDSMYPEYKSGSIAALREVKNKRLVVYGQDYLIETSEYRVIKRLQKSEYPQNWLACSVNEEKYEGTGRLIHEPFDVHIDDVIRLYQVLGNVKRNQSSTVIHANGKAKN
jgi:phage repressor protein C with HTH and peptisase S24 domain